MVVQGTLHLHFITLNVFLMVVLNVAARTHTKADKFLDVRTYTPFGQGVFLASEVPSARIASVDVLSMLPPLEDKEDLLNQGMLELPQTAFSQYVELTSCHTKKYESLWSAWLSKH